ncbi:MAG: LptA/OstA family protein [Aestuariivita sp.]|nr:LptA/OstA family protein [Aestuariivita sp.]
MKFLFYCLVSIVFSGVSGTVSAQELLFGSIKLDTSLPVELSADELAIDQTSRKAVFSGNVSISQGDMMLSAPSVIVVYGESTGSISQLQATGGVLLVRGRDAAEADQADYNVDDGIITMKGNVLFEQLVGTLAADEMTVNLVQGTAEMVGRVTAILQDENE